MAASASRGCCLRPRSPRRAARGPLLPLALHPPSPGRPRLHPQACGRALPPLEERSLGSGCEPECFPLGRGKGESSRPAVQRPSWLRAPARGPADPRRGPAWCQGDARACARPRARPPNDTHSHSHSHPAVLFVPGQAHFRKWLESLERHLTEAAKSWLWVEVRTREAGLRVGWGEAPRRGRSPPPLSLYIGTRQPPPPATPSTRRHTCFGTPEHPPPPPGSPLSQGSMPAQPVCLSPGTVPSSPVLASLPDSPRPQKRTDCLAPALIGSWCFSSSLFFLLGCDGKSQEALVGHTCFPEGTAT